MTNLHRFIRALSHPVQHIVALRRISRTFRNWLPLAVRYLAHHTAEVPFYAYFCNGDGKILIEGRADLSNLWAIFGREEYQVLPDDRKIIDIGANIGLFAIFAARRAPRAHITAFEPVASTFSTLENNITLCKVGDRIATVNAAISSIEGSQRIYLGNSSDLASLTPTSSDQAYQMAESKTINTILRDYTESVSLLKMDCEGAEWEILASADEHIKKVDRLCVEYHSVTTEKLSNAITHLKQLGFHHERVQLHGAGHTAVVCTRRAEPSDA